MFSYEVPAAVDLYGWGLPIDILKAWDTITNYVEVTNNEDSYHVVPSSSNEQRTRVIHSWDHTPVW